MIDRRLWEAIGLAILASAFGWLALGLLYVSGGF